MASVFVSKAMSKKVMKNFVYEIPDFMEEAEMMTTSKKDRKLTSPPFYFQALDSECFTGSIMVSKSRQSPKEIEIVGVVSEAQTQTEVPSPWETKNSLKVELMSPQGKLLEKACVHDGTRHRSSGGPGITWWSSKASITLSLKECKDSVALESLIGKIWLRATSATTVFFDKPSNSEWEKVPRSDSVLEVRPRSAPAFQYLKSRKDSDLVIECDGNQYPVHSFVLKNASPVLAAMPRHDMEEAGTDLRRIIINDVDSEPVERMVKFLYTGELVHDDEDQAQETTDLLIEWLQCADKYQFSEMKEECLMQMQARLGVENCIKFLKAAKLYRAEEAIIDRMFEFCKANLHKLPKGEETQGFISKNKKKLF